MFTSQLYKLSITKLRKEVEKVEKSKRKVRFREESKEN